MYQLFESSAPLNKDKIKLEIKRRYKNVKAQPLVRANFLFVSIVIIVVLAVSATAIVLDNAQRTYDFTWKEVQEEQWDKYANMLDYGDIKFVYAAYDGSDKVGLSQVYTNEMLGQVEFIEYSIFNNSKYIGKEFMSLENFIIIDNIKIWYGEGKKNEKFIYLYRYENKGMKYCMKVNSPKEKANDFYLQVLINSIRAETTK